MRLLKLGDSDRLAFTEDLNERERPDYAILSHTWGKAADEVTYQDMLNSSAESKAGYDKIRFCAKQAKKDRIRYIWVDTCCIDKTNLVELSEAINSMFKWYAKARSCYVYLADVFQKYEGHSLELDVSVKDQLRLSRWFTRGWTLQELLAPKFVEFYSASWTCLGDIASLEELISDITRIPIQALRGGSLANFTLMERFSWQDSRQTTREEDLAYALLGIFDVHMPLIYGEGRQNAYRRLKAEIENKAFGSRGQRQNEFSVNSSIQGLAEAGQLVARDSEMLEMRRALSSNGRRRSITLFGTEGVGKSELATAYCVRHREQYSAIFWFNARDENSIESSFITAAEQILHDQPSVKGISIGDANYRAGNVIDGVKAWLNLPNNTRWLLVFDGVNNFRYSADTTYSGIFLRKFIPGANQGSVLVTTRSSRLSIGTCLHVRSLTDITDFVKILEESSQREDPTARAIVTRMDGLPLAIKTAGLCLNQSSTSLRNYMQCYENAWKRSLSRFPDTLSMETRILYTTWQVSLDRIRSRNRHSAILLDLWVYFDSQDLWYELLCKSEPGDPAWISELTRSERDFHSAIGVLCDFGLAEVRRNFDINSEPICFSICSSVHEWMRSTVHSTMPQLIQFAVRCVASRVPSSKGVSSRSLRRRLLGHASYGLMKYSDPATDGLGYQFFDLGKLCVDENKIEQAEQMYKRALMEFEAVEPASADSSKVADTLYNLGQIYYKQGNYKAAEKLFRQAYLKYEMTLGSQDKYTQEAASELGLACRKQGKLSEAAKTYENVLLQMEKATEPDNHPIRSLPFNLGLVYKNQGKFAEAERMFQTALKSYERELGPDHVETLQCPVVELGCTYLDRGNYDAAAKMYCRAIQALGRMETEQEAKLERLGKRLPKYKLKEAQWAFSKEAQSTSDDSQANIRTYQGVRDSNNRGALAAESKTDPVVTPDSNAQQQTSSDPVFDRRPGSKSRRDLEEVRSLKRRRM